MLTHDNFLAIAGVAAGLVGFVGTLPYIRDIFRGKTKPERAMWWIYSLLFGVLFIAQLDANAGWLLVATAVYVLSAVIIAILSVPYGYGRFHRRDWLSLVVAVAGLGLWWLTDSPLLAIILVIIIDFAGFWLTLVKTWRAPHSETLISWQLSCIAAALSLLSIHYWTMAVIIYPIYAVLGTGLIVWLIMYRRRQVAEDVADF